MDAKTCSIILRSQRYHELCNAYFQVLHGIIQSINNTVSRVPWVHALSHAPIDTLRKHNGFLQSILQLATAIMNKLNFHNDFTMDEYNTIINFFSNKDIIDTAIEYTMNYDPNESESGIGFGWYTISMFVCYIPKFLDTLTCYDHVLILSTGEISNVLERFTGNWDEQTYYMYPIIVRIHNTLDVIDVLLKSKGMSLNADSASVILSLFHKLEKETVNIASNTKYWHEKCITRVMSMLIDALLAAPLLAKLVITLNECCSMMNSSHWQCQYVCLTLLSCRIELDLVEEQELIRRSITELDSRIKEEQAAILNNGKVRTTSMNAKSAKSVSSVKSSRIGVTSQDSNDSVNGRESKKAANTRRSSKSTTTRVRSLDELCRNGFLKYLCYSMLHSMHLCRKVATKIMDSFLKIANISAENSNNQELWASFIEQGLIPLLEMITCGYSVQLLNSQSKLRFPENYIRATADSLLQNTALTLNAHQSVQTRIMSALVHTGSPKLRANIFCGILCVAPRLPSLGSLLWSGNVQRASQTLSLSSTNSADGELFLKLLENMYKDPTELSDIIAIMHLFTECSYSIVKPLNGETASKSSRDTKALSLILRGGPTVLVNNDGHMVKMLCPTPSAILNHSEELYALLNDLLEKQKAVPGSEPTKDDNAQGIVLNGTYYVWQEVFSHMVDDLILESSVDNMSSDSIYEAFYICRRYKMSKLAYRYAITLAKRLNPDTFIPTLECAIGLKSESINALRNNSIIDISLIDPNIMKYTAKPHLYLVSQCLFYIEKNLEKIIIKRKPVRVTESISLLHKLLKHLFICK